MQKIKIVGKHYMEIKKDRQHILLVKERGNKYPPKDLVPTDAELTFAVMLNEKQYKKLASDKEKFLFEGELLKDKLHEDADFSFVCYHVGDVDNKEDKLDVEKSVEEKEDVNEETKNVENNTWKKQKKNAAETEEIIVKNIDSIKIPPRFKMPKQEKVDEKIKLMQEENGVNTKPVLLSEKNILIDGYTTYLACKHLGISDIKCKQVVFQKKIKNSKCTIE